jgi:hypothetical protein
MLLSVFQHVLAGLAEPRSPISRCMITPCYSRLDIVLVSCNGHVGALQDPAFQASMPVLMGRDCVFDSCRGMGGGLKRVGQNKDYKWIEADCASQMLSEF